MGVLMIDQPQNNATSGDASIAEPRRGESQTQTTTPTKPEWELLTKRLPPHAVILHNDDVNDMDHVVQSLVRSVPSLTGNKATEIMREAHDKGRARVVVCPLELAELYRDRLRGCRLTATIEKV